MKTFGWVGSSGGSGGGGARVKDGRILTGVASYVGQRNLYYSYIGSTNYPKSHRIWVKVRGESPLFVSTFNSGRPNGIQRFYLHSECLDVTAKQHGRC